MGVIADEMERLGGTHIGVLPRFMKGLEFPNLTELVWTDTMAERKERMRAGTSAVIALPGGIGYDGKLLVLNVDGFFDPFKALLDHYEATGMLTPADRALIHFADTVPELAEHLK